ncbi:MAG: hypothetical protein E7287_10705 [Lachnospiraceae bacterium]|nr:hypothetical protein [Lachnospiraceae bacterium]
MAMLLLTGSSYAQFITVLVVFVIVLGITAWTTKWIANYQKKQAVNCNIQLLEAARLGNNKYIQIVRVGDTYMVLAVCKDTVTMLGEISPEQLKETGDSKDTGFKQLLEKMMHKDSDYTDTPKE